MRKQPMKASPISVKTSLEWKAVDEEKGILGYYELRSKSGKTLLCLMHRPPHCDRGNFYAIIETTETHIDGADMFPRYYFDLERAKLELEAFLKKRGLQ